MFYFLVLNSGSVFAGNDLSLLSGASTATLLFITIYPNLLFYIPWTSSQNGINT